MLKYSFPSEPVADPDAIISGPKYRFTVINDVVLRYEWAEDGVFEDRPSTFAINRRFAHRPKPLVKENERGLEIITPTFHLSYDKKRFSSNGLTATMNSKTTLWGASWRYGWTPEANLGGTARTLDDTNGRLDMGSGVLSKAGYSIIDDSKSMLFDGDFVAPRRSGDRIDGYLFVYGRDFKAAMKAFFDISGHTPRLPRWSLGNWWSRFHRYTAESYLQLMDKFKEYSIPMSVAVVDMDWHLWHEKEVVHAGWTGYTWSKSLFPDPVKFADELHKRRLKMTLNDHPHEGVGAHEEQYKEVAKRLHHDTADKTTIPFDPSDPKFMAAYFEILHRSLEKKGADFWWIDWQQGPISRVPGLDPLWLLNHYQFLDTKQQVGDSDALIFSRYAGPGSHRYPVGFSGDAIITWASLEFQPEFTATASNIGYGWWSHDIGGHLGGSRDDELVTRWVQFGVFSPIMRLHSSNSPWGSKEPWLYRPEAQQVMTEFLQLRHRLIPYIYTANASFASDNEALVQPLYWRHSQREEAFQYPNEYFFGKSLVVAPVVKPRDVRTQLAPVKVWIPPTASRHIDIYNGTVYDSDREIELWRSLEEIPVLAPEGTIIPLDAALKPGNGGANPHNFELLVIVGRDAEFTIVEDVRDDIEAKEASSDNRRVIPIKWDQKAGVLTVHGPVGRGWMIRFLSCLDKEQASSVDVVFSRSSANTSTSPVDSRVTDTTVQVTETAAKQAGTFTVSIGKDPQLNIVNHSAKIRRLLLDFQIDFGLKDRIFSITESKQPVAVKVGRLLSLGLESAISGPIVELLLADSR